MLGAKGSRLWTPAYGGGSQSAPATVLRWRSSQGRGLCASALPLSPPPPSLLLSCASSAAADTWQTTGSSSDLKCGPMLSSGRRALSPARDASAKYEGMVALLTSQPWYCRSPAAMHGPLLTAASITSIIEKRIDSADVEGLARSLIHISQAQKTTCSTIHGMIRMEFSCKQVNTILRGNSLTTKLQTTFCSALLRSRPRRRFEPQLTAGDRASREGLPQDPLR